MSASENLGSEFTKGELVRFERYGEWLDGKVVIVENGMICITHGVHGDCSWRWQGSAGVVLVERATA